jgi:hypothetical protein
MSLEEQVDLYKELRSKIEMLEGQKKAVAATIAQLMEADKVDLGGCIVRRYKRLYITLSLDNARALGATKTKEAVDQQKIKELHKLGHVIKGVSEITLIQVSKVKEETPVV